MDPVWLLLWSVVALYAGFLAGRIIPGMYYEHWRAQYAQWQRSRLADGPWRLAGPPEGYVRDVMYGLGALAAILGTSTGIGLLLYPELFTPTVLSFSLAAGLTWGATAWGWPWPTPVQVYAGNHEWNTIMSRYRETWSQRLARWGFPSSEQMAMAAFREDLRGRLSLVSRPHRSEQRNDPGDSLSGILPPW